jgi:hypothetical protein
MLCLFNRIRVPVVHPDLKALTQNPSDRILYCRFLFPLYRYTTESFFSAPSLGIISLLGHKRKEASIPRALHLIASTVYQTNVVGNLK